MDGVHDLGGKHGFGGSLTERDEASFHAPWEERVFAMTAILMGRGCFNIDAMRHALERLDPATYLTASYFGRWLSTMEKLIEEAGGRPPPADERNLSARRHIEAAPRFDVGQAVRTKNIHPPGHTRLPGYARDKRGKIVLRQGSWVFPDTNAHGLGEHPEHVYAVRFEGNEIWGPDAESGTCIYLDCFESYLEPA
ncbi:MAG: nitrile hydratase subunit beta [Deltaproteobacteria bacterium]|jgi:nitrile hydratase|nr:nitrile hydratase subunit beta [Deltaproteobacteria bacterium]